MIDVNEMQLGDLHTKHLTIPRKTIAAIYTDWLADMPNGYVYAFKNDDQADLDAATTGEAVWVTLAPRG